MNSQVFGCPSCSQPFQVLAEQAGQVVQCPCCAQTVEIPASAFAPTAPDSAPTPPAQPQVMQCGNCDGQFGVTNQMMGQDVACPHCQELVRIPVGDDPVVPETETSETPEIQIIVRKKSKPKITPFEPSDDDLLPPKRVTDKSSERSPIATPIFNPKRKSKTKIQLPSELVESPTLETAQPSSTRPAPLDSTPTPQPTKDTTLSSSQAAEHKPQKPESVSGKSQSVDPKKLAPQLPPATQPAQATPSPSSATLRVSAAIVDESVAEEAQSVKPDDIDAAVIDRRHNGSIEHLLPPRFDVADPTRLRVGSAEEHKIFLPDGAGGTKQIDQRVVSVDHHGKKVTLLTLTPEQRRRKRIITNTIMILIGILVMFLAFTFLK